MNWYNCLHLILTERHSPIHSFFISDLTLCGFNLRIWVLEFWTNVNYWDNDYFIKKNPFLLSYFPDLYFWHGISLLLYGISLFTGFSLLLNYFSLLLVWEYRLCHICVCVCVCECIFDLNGLLNVMAASWQQRLFPFLHFDLKLIRHTLPEEEKKLKKESTSAQHTRKPGVSIHLCTWERMDWTAEEVAEQGKWHWIWWQQRSHGREGRAQSVSELVQQFWKRR